MYSIKTRVRYSECDSKQQAGLSSILDYLQDVCTFQSEDLGIGVGFMRNHHAAWFLSSWQVDIERYPHMGENLKIMTWPYDFHGFYGFRNFKVEDEAGNTIVKANSVWVFMDVEKGRPVRLLSEFSERYEKLPKLDMEYMERKIADFQPAEDGTLFTVPRHFIDTNCHMNNTKYVVLAAELLPEDLEVCRQHAEYRHAAKQGDRIYPAYSMEPGKMSVKLNDQNGMPYAVMELFRSV